jgi:hypothetical protein
MRSLAERLCDLAAVGTLVPDDLRYAANVLERADATLLAGTPRAAEERLAWDRYAAAALGMYMRELPENEITTNIQIAGWAANDADRLLEERRKRFGEDK